MELKGELIKKCQCTQVIPDLTCSASGSTSISFTTSNYMSSTAPAWIVIDSSTGMLNVTAPTVSTDTEFDFYIDSNIAGISQPIKKLIKINILDCKATNWNKCNSTNNSVWEVWSSGYTLSSGSWTLQSVNQTTNVTSNVTTEAAKKVSTAAASVGATTMGVTRRYYPPYPQEGDSFLKKKIS